MSKEKNEPRDSSNDFSDPALEVFAEELASYLEASSDNLSAALTAQPWELGQVIENRWEVTGHTSGGMGNIYFVRDRSADGHLMAVKSLITKGVNEELISSRRQLFRTETQNWLDLGAHPHIVTGFYTLELDSELRFFMEYVPGHSLAESMIQSRYIIKDALDLAIQIASGVSYIHAQGIVHRDLKPSNCLLTTGNHLRITDMGLSRPVGALSFSAGTPDYMAPEQWASVHHTEPAADIYSYGIMLWEMLTGMHPYTEFIAPHRLSKNERWQRLCYLHSHAEAILEDDRGTIPPDIRAIIHRCICKSPEKRLVASKIQKKLIEVYNRHTQRPYPRTNPNPVELGESSINNRAASYYVMGKRAKARKILRDWLEQYPLSLYPWLNLHGIDVHEGRLELADIPAAAIHRANATQLKSSPRLSEFTALIAARQLRHSTYSIDAIAFSRNGKFLGTACSKFAYEPRNAYTRDFSVGVWNLDTGSVRYFLEGPTGFRGRPSVSFNADSTLLTLAVDGGEYGSVASRIWTLDDGKILYTGYLHSSHKPGNLSVQNSWFHWYHGHAAPLPQWHNGKRTFLFWGSRSIKIASIQSWAHQSIPQRPGKPFDLSNPIDIVVELIELTAEERFSFARLDENEDLIIAGTSLGNVYIWNIDGRLLFKNACHSKAVTDVCISRDRHLLASAAEDESLRVWNLQTGRILDSFQCAAETIAFLKDDGGIMATTANGTTLYWKFGYDSQRREIDGKILDNRGGILLLKVDRRVRVVDENTMIETREHVPGTGTCALSPDGKIFAAASGHSVLLRDTRCIQRPDWVPVLTQPQSAARLIERDSRKLALIRELKTLSMRGYSAAKSLCQEFPELEYDFETVTSIHDFQIAVGAPSLKTVSQFSQIRTQANIRTITASPEGRLLAVATHSDEILLYETESLECVRKLDHFDNISHIHFANSQEIVVADRKRIRQCSIYKNDCTSLVEFERSETCLELGAKGSALVRCAESKYENSLQIRSQSFVTNLGIRDWNLDSQVFVFRNDERILYGAHAQGKIGSMRAWDTHTGACLARFESVFKYVEELRSLKTSLDGRYVFLGSLQFGLPTSGAITGWETGSGDSRVRVTRLPEIDSLDLHSGTFLVLTKHATFVSLWSMISGARIAEIPSDSPIRSACFGGESPFLVLASEDGLVDMFRIENDYAFLDDLIERIERALEEIPLEEEITHEIVILGLERRKVPTSQRMDFWLNWWQVIKRGSRLHDVSQNLGRRIALVREGILRRLVHLAEKWQGYTDFSAMSDSVTRIQSPIYQAWLVDQDLAADLTVRLGGDRNSIVSFC